MSITHAMIDLSQVKNYYVVAGYTDLRKGLIGLAAIVAGVYGQNLDNESLFLFCGKRTSKVKALYWAGTGFAIISFELGGGRYRWPRNPPGLLKMTREEFESLLTADKNGAFPTYSKDCPYDLF